MTKKQAIMIAKNIIREMEIIRTEESVYFTVNDLKKEITVAILEAYKLGKEEGENEAYEKSALSAKWESDVNEH